MRAGKNYIARTFKTEKAILCLLGFSINTGEKNTEDGILFPQSIKSVVLEMISAPFPMVSSPKSVPSFLRSTTVLELSAGNSFLFFPIFSDRIIEVRDRDRERERERGSWNNHYRAFTLSLPAARLIYFIDFRPAAAQPISPADYQSSKSNNIISLRLPSVRGPIPFPWAWRNPAAKFMGTPWPRRSLSTRVLNVCKETLPTRAPTWNKVTPLAPLAGMAVLRPATCSCDKFSSALTVLRAAAEWYFQSFI